MQSAGGLSGYLAWLRLGRETPHGEVFLPKPHLFRLLRMWGDFHTAWLEGAQLSYGVVTSVSVQFTFAFTTGGCKGSPARPPLIGGACACRCCSALRRTVHSHADCALASKRLATGLQINRLQTAHPTPNRIHSKRLQTANRSCDEAELRSEGAPGETSPGCGNRGAIPVPLSP